jgi:hypothetical protein
VHERRCQIDGRGRLADSAFLVSDGDRLHRISRLLKHPARPGG